MAGTGNSGSSGGSANRSQRARRSEPGGAKTRTDGRSSSKGPAGSSAKRATPGASSGVKASRSAPGRITSSSQNQRGARNARNAPGHSSKATLYGVIATVLVVVIVLVVVLVAVTKSKSTGPIEHESLAPASIVHEIATVPESVLNKVGLASGHVTVQGALEKISGQPPLTSGGKPEVVYFGSEYCPFCAATRWPIAVALSKFGTFTHLGMIESSITDVDPGTKTLDFYGSHYSSPYVTFDPTEQCTNIPAPPGAPSCAGYTFLQTPTPQISRLVSKYDSPTFFPADTQGGSIPFMDYANHYLLSGAVYNPGDLTGLSHAEIAASLDNPSTIPGQDIDGAANYFIAAVCGVTGNRPGRVCDQPAVKRAAASIPVSSAK